MNKKNLFRALWKVTKLLLAIILIVVVVSKTNIAQLKTIKNDLAWGWLFLHFFSYVLMTLLKAYQYHALFRTDNKYKEILRIVIWQNAISNFIATSAGVASYMAMLKAEQDVKLTRSGAIFLITKFGDLVAIGLVLLVSTSFVWQQVQPLQWLSVLIIGVLFLGLIVFLIMVVYHKSLFKILINGFVFLRLNRFSFVARGMDGLQTLSSEKKDNIYKLLRTAVLVSFGYMAVTMLSAYTGIRMFNIHLGVWAILYVAALMQLVSFVPIQVLGGLGVMEVTSVYLYSFFSLDQGAMSAVMLGLRAVFYLMNLLVLFYLPLSALFDKKITLLNHES